MRRAFQISLVLLIACGPFFYEAPPLLVEYPERVAAKRWHHLFSEISPRDPALPDEKSLAETCRNLPQILEPLDDAKRLAEIDRLLVENRSGDYSSNRANFLHEIRELCVDPTLFVAAKPYLEWRINPENSAPGTPPVTLPWNMKEEEFKNLLRFYQERIRKTLADIDKQTASVGPKLKPYWKVRKGAFLYELRRYVDAGKEFAAVAKEHPNHARAEVASLMQARCKIEQSRQQVDEQPTNKQNPTEQDAFQNLTDAENLLLAFIERYPKGRFTPDAEGWLGAIAMDRGQLGLAVKHQITRMEQQPTREITRSVLRECGFIFDQLLNSQINRIDIEQCDPKEHFDAAAVARHPVIARLFVHHCIDPAADITLPLWWDQRGNGGRTTIDFLNRRIFKPKPFIRLALKNLGKELLTSNNKPDATTLILLAWSASEDGENEQALALLNSIKDQAPSDEQLHASAIILQRLNRHADAVKAFDALAKNFPDSKLTGDLIYRRSISLFKSGNTGKAIADIAQQIYQKPVRSENGAESQATPSSLQPSLQLTQWLDSMVQFSPLDQLEAALAAVPPQSRAFEILQQAIRTRALAARNFDLAAKHLTVESDVHVAEWEWPIPDLANKRRMSRAIWDLHAAPLAELYSKLRTAGNDAEKAKIHLTIACHWMDHRGTLTMPANALCYYAESDKEKQNLLRRRNAIDLGFDREAVNRELDRRDEATHALEHALEAAKSGDISIAAPALELANNALFRRAELSLYHRSRALETGDTAISADIHQQLLKRFPTSPEAARSLYLTISPHAGPWMPGDYNSYNAVAIMLNELSGQKNRWVEIDQDLEKQLNALPAAFEKIDRKKPLPEIQRDLDAARSELDKLRPQTNPENQLWVIDRLDDLKAAASLPGVTTQEFIDYANGRTDKLSPAFASLLDFRARLKTQMDTNGNETGPINDTIEGWQEFLLTYPDSVKAEAASLRLTRLIARKFRTSRSISAFPFPQAPIPNGYKRVKVTRKEPANDPNAVLAAIQNHETRFPAGRYRDDLNLLKAGALIDTGDFKQALDLLAPIIDNPIQKDLHAIAALEFADICQRLLVPEQRSAVAAALRSSPNEIKRLKLLVNGDTFLSRLQPLIPWLENPG